MNNTLHGLIIKKNRLQSQLSKTETVFARLKEHQHQELKRRAEAMLHELEFNNPREMINEISEIFNVKGRGVSPHVKRKALELIRSGATIVETAKQCGVSDVTIQTWKRKAGLVKSQNKREHSV